MNSRFALRGHAISQTFVFLLLGVFAVFSTLMVLLGAQFYRDIVLQTEDHNANRVLCSYLMNAVRGNSVSDAVYVDQQQGVDMLVLAWDADGETYETKIYCYEGALRELFGSAKQEFEPDYGEEICKAEAFFPEIENGMLKMQVTGTNGYQRTLHMALHSSLEDML